MSTVVRWSSEPSPSSRQGRKALPPEVVELVIPGTLVPPARWGTQGLEEGEEKGAVVRWRSIKREVNGGLSGPPVRPARSGRRAAASYAQQLIVEDRVQGQEVEVQDSLATMAKLVLAASSWGRRGAEGETGRLERRAAPELRPKVREHLEPCTQLWHLGLTNGRAGPLAGPALRVRIGQLE